MTPCHPEVVDWAQQWIETLWLLTHTIVNSFLVPLDGHSTGWHELTFVHSLSCDTETFHCSRSPLCRMVSCFPEPQMSTRLFIFLVLSWLKAHRVGVIQRWSFQDGFFHLSNTHRSLSGQLSHSFLFRVSWYLIVCLQFCSLYSTEGQLVYIPIFNNPEQNCYKWT